jgi:hypothetical protein
MAASSTQKPQDKTPAPPAQDPSQTTTTTPPPAEPSQPTTTPPPAQDTGQTTPAQQPARPDRPARAPQSGQAGPADGVASPEQNAALKHSRDGVTTRQDLLDAGVPMLPGDPRERQGPEDALGAGPKRGDYTSRIGGSDYHPHTSEPIPEDEQEPDGPTTRLVPQRPRAEDIGDVPRRKGGVETADEEQ